MASQINGSHEDDHTGISTYDVIVVGAGFAGIRMAFELQKLGVSFKVLEEGSNVGGTWYWNRYPGARTDIESWVYILNISKELNDEWTWKERYPTQGEVLEYLNHAADRFDIRKDIRFNTHVRSAVYDNSKNFWKINTAQAGQYTCKYFVPATGALSMGVDLPFPHVDKFKGESYRTCMWPHNPIDFQGKRVGIIGTGATSVQLIPILAHSAASVTVFQRTPNYVIPARNHPLTSDQSNEIKRSYEEVWQHAKSEAFGASLKDATLNMKDMNNQTAIQRILEHGWETGGFNFVFGTFADLLVSEESNRVASDFVRNKIRAIVKDEATAELLCPDYPLMAKRPPLGHHYFEAFNKPHVTLVDIKSNPIKEITENGILLTGNDIRSGKDHYDFDVIIYALGFDVSTGPLTRLEVRGKDGQILSESWNKTLATYLGIMVEGFPNMFMMSGPQIPFANFPVTLDNTATWIGQCIKHVQENNYIMIEPEGDAMDRWSKLVSAVFEMTVLPAAAKKNRSWFVGANVPGKPVRPLFWFGGVPSYFENCNAEANAGFPSLRAS